MRISEIRMKLADDPHDRLKAFCSIAFDGCFVVHDVKVIRGPHGLFVAMPSRKLTEHCPHCGEKNPLAANFCNQCGERVQVESTTIEADFGNRGYADVAHPINAEFRQAIERRVIQAYGEELARAQQPSYVPSSDRPKENWPSGTSKY